MSDTTRPRIALVGCGAVAESFHLGALDALMNLSAGLFLVDRDVDRLEELRARLDVAGDARDYREVVDKVDGAIVATPPHLHAPIAEAFLRAGVHVLCEKPLSTSHSEVMRLLDAAQEGGATIGVNQTRRLYPSFRRVRELIDSGALGRLRRIEFAEGEPFDWPAASSSYFGARANGGVLLDRGAHILDLVCWWLPGRLEDVKYRDDSRGGTEAVADVRCQIDGCRVAVRLSWLAKLSNRFAVVGEEGTVSGKIYDWDEVRRGGPEGGGDRERLARLRPTTEDFARELLENFLSVCLGEAEPLIPAAEVERSIRLMEECYHSRSSFEMPWMTFPPDREDGV